MAAVGVRWPRLRLLAVIPLALILSVPGSAAPALAAPVPAQVSDVGLDGLQGLAECLRSSPDLAALLVVDESKSLRDTDPENKRAALLASVVDSLSGLVGQQFGEQTRRVAAEVMFFGEGAEQVPSRPWTILDEDSATDLSNWILAEVPARTEGSATDYRAALAQARSELASGVAQFEPTASPCKVVFFFTDGRNNVGTPEEDAAALADICEAGGVIDQLRGDQDTLVAVRLVVPPQPNAPQDPREVAKDVESREDLQGIAEGDSPNSARGDCGELREGPNTAGGTYLEGSIDVLAVLFGTALGVGAGGTAVPGLSGSPLEFTVDKGVASFQLVAQAPDGFTLEPPLGDALTNGMGGSATSVAGVEGSIRWAGTAFTLVLPVGADGVGTWTLTRPGRTDDDVSLVLFSGLRITLEDPLLVVDEESQLNGRVVSADGSPVDMTVYSSADIDVTPISASGEGEPIPMQLNPDGSFTGAFTPTGEGSQVRFLITLNITTASGQELSPVNRPFKFPVRLSDIYPHIDPAQLDFGALGKPGQTSTVTVDLFGSPKGATSVCFPGTSTIETVTEATVTLDGPDECIELEAGQSKAVDFRLTLADAVTDGGEVRGEIPFEFHSANSPDAASKTKPVPVPLTAQVVAIPPLLWVIPVLLGLAILLPLLILWGIGWWAAKLNLNNLNRAEVAVRMTPNSVGGWTLTRAPSATGESADTSRLFSARDFESMHTDLGMVRDWRAPSGETLTSRMSRNPFGSPRDLVVVGQGRFVISNGDPSVSSRHAYRQGGIDSRQEAFAYLILSAPVARDEAVEASLVVYVRSGRDDINDVVGSVAADLATFPGWAEGIDEIALSAVSADRPASAVPHDGARPTQRWDSGLDGPRVEGKPDGSSGPAPLSFD